MKDEKIKIITTDPGPEGTLGKQVYDKIISSKDEKGPETREVSLEHGIKLTDQLQKIIEKHLDYAKKYYIIIFGTSEVASHHINRIKIIVRQTLPLPEWKQTVFSYDNRKNELNYLWSLPNKETSNLMLLNPDGFDKDLINYIREFLDGSLEKFAIEENEKTVKINHNR